MRGTQLLSSPPKPRARVHWFLAFFHTPPRAALEFFNGTLYAPSCGQHNVPEKEKSLFCAPEGSRRSSLQGSTENGLFHPIFEQTPQQL